MSFKLSSDHLIEKPFSLPYNEFKFQKSIQDKLYGNVDVYSSNNKGPQIFSLQIILMD